MGNRVIVISVVYEEPDWRQTRNCLERLNCPVFYVGRKGVGSLARAINVGFLSYTTSTTEYVWFVTNVTWKSGLLEKLITEMDLGGWAAIHPCFASDHVHAQPAGVDETRAVPFIEFTAPMVRVDIFKRFLLDERMPYWGHDLDWGYRVSQAGHKIGVYHGQQLEHTYIRNNKQHHPITVERARLRRTTDQSTRVALEQKYGPQWRKLVWK